MRALRETTAKFYVAIAIALLAATLPVSAHAQSDERDARAREFFAVGKYQEALELYGKLYAETLHPTYLRNIGRCYQNLGEPDRAISSFREYLRQAKGLDAQKRQEVEGFIAEMEELKRSRATAPATPPPAPEITQPPIAASLEPPPRRGLSRTQITGLAVAGAGVLALGVGGFYSYEVKSAENGTNDLVHDPNAQLTDDMLRKRDRDGARFEALQWTFYAIGLAAVAAGATTFYFGTRSAERTQSGVVSLAPVLGPGLFGSALRGSF